MSVKKKNRHQTRRHQKGRYFWFSYPAPARARRGHKYLHLIRDGAAFAELAPVLMSMDYSYEGLLLNYPSSESPGIEHDDLGLTPADLLVLPTRPPISDEQEEERRRVERSHNLLENRVLGSLDPFLEICSRAHVKLSRALSEKLPKQFANRANIEFTLYRNAFCKHYQGYADTEWDAPDAPTTTMTYLAYTPSLWPGGPALLLSFGLGGIETLIWCLLLRTQYSSLLKEIVRGGQKRFVMGEMIAPKRTSTPSVWLEAEAYQLELVANTSLP